MYEVNVMVYGPEGEDLGYKRYCSNDELEQLLRTCDSSEIEYKELKEARYSESMGTCFAHIVCEWNSCKIIKKFIPVKIATINTL